MFFFRDVHSSMKVCNDMSDIRLLTLQKGGGKKEIYI